MTAVTGYCPACIARDYRNDWQQPWTEPRLCFQCENRAKFFARTLYIPRGAVIAEEKPKRKYEQAELFEAAP